MYLFIFKSDLYTAADRHQDLVSRVLQIQKMFVVTTIYMYPQCRIAGPGREHHPRLGVNAVRCKPLLEVVQ